MERGRQHDLDELGIAKNAREEKIRARDEKLKAQQEAKDREMEKLYREARSRRERARRQASCRSARSPRRRRNPAKKSAASATNSVSVSIEIQAAGIHQRPFSMAGYRGTDSRFVAPASNVSSSDTRKGLDKTAHLLSGFSSPPGSMSSYPDI